MATQALIMLDVMAPESPRVARVLSNESGVQYAAAVWGPWDVASFIQVRDISSLIDLLDKIRDDSAYVDVTRTETWLIRPDQFDDDGEIPSGHDTGVAFVFFSTPRDVKETAKARTNRVLKALQNLKKSPSNGSRILHAVGVLGPYDIATMVEYDNDVSLRQFVMARCKQD